MPKQDFSHQIFFRGGKKINLKERNTIQKFLAFFLLIVFAISSTPKIYFHDVIANHKDVVSFCDHPQKSKACLHQKGYDCEVNDLVVTTPYLILPVVNTFLIHSDYSDFNTGYLSSSSQNCLIHKESRGPPSI